MPHPFPGDDYTKKGKKIEFKNLSPNHWDNFNQTCHKISLGDARSHIFKKELNSDIVHILLQLKIFLESQRHTKDLTY